MNMIIGEYQNNYLKIVYIKNPNGKVGIVFVPVSLNRKISIAEQHVDSLVHVGILGGVAKCGFANGSTMRNTSTTEELQYSHQEISRTNNYTMVSTILRHHCGLRISHKLKLFDSRQAVECWVEAAMENDNCVTIQMLTSFSVNTHLFKNTKDSEIKLHRLLSYWSSEGRKLSQTMEDLNFEPSWSGHGLRSLKFGALGSLPVKGFFTFGAVQDIANGICWGAMLKVPYSWQMELTRYKDELCFSGGIADREFGHFEKELQGEDIFITPKAIICAVSGDEEDSLRAINEYLNNEIVYCPESEKTVPIVFNEFCTTWGNPSIQKIKAMADKIKTLGFGYFVIDSGWYQTPDGNWENNMGDWTSSKKLFPKGIKEAADYVKSCGMIPGLWFELESVGVDSVAAAKSQDWLLKKDGCTIVAGKRRFWDMQNPSVREYLRDRVFRLLKDNGFGYIKIDYNESIGVGCDGYESLGEGLRRNMLAVQSFLVELHGSIPGIIVENCASGGHRAEPSMLMLSSMNSFSDAHECQSIPVIAANVGRVVPARQNQIWCVLRKNDDTRRAIYSLAATMIGRMCISGDILEMDGNQEKLLSEAINFYKRINSVIIKGNQYIYREGEGSYNNPRGSQVIVRKNDETRSILAVGHGFEKSREMNVDIPKNAEIIDGFGKQNFTIVDSKLLYTPSADFSACAAYIRYK